MKKKIARRIRLNAESLRPLDAATVQVNGGGSFVESVRICSTYVPNESLHC
jgi:hypothetical protein